MKYIKLFETISEYNTWLNSNDYITPYVATDKESKKVSYQTKIYDAEIEYLYVNGSKGCYIDTGITPDANTGVYAKLYTSHFNDEYIIGVRNNTTDTRWLIGHSSNGWYCGYGEAIFIEDNRQPYINEIYEIELNFKNSGKMSNLTNDTYKNLPILNFIPENSITLFKANCFDNNLINQSFMTASCGIYEVKISQGNNIIMHLIPVRKDGVGYMFDKISKHLFSNQGTGTFILGPDK